VNRGVSYSTLAAREVGTTAAEYDEKAPGLGHRFLDEIEHAEYQIARFPESAPAFGSKFRRILLNRFPFGLVYTLRGDQIWIVAVMHQRRGPSFISRRLKKEGGV
jgi:toxin ParE1/3/4